MTAMKVPPAIARARRALVESLPHLTTMQLFRLTETAQLLAYGEHRGHWSLNDEGTEQHPQAYALDGQPRRIPKDRRVR